MTAVAAHSTRSPILRSVLVWTVAIGLLAYLGLTTNLSEVWDTVTGVRFELLIPAVLFGNLIVFVWDTRCLVTLFGRLNRPVAFRDMLPVKGASYFFNIVNYNAAAAAMALFLKRKARIPFLEGASSMLLLNVVDVLALNVLISVGLLLTPEAVSDAMRESLLLVNVVVYAIVGGSFLYWNAGFDFFVLGRLRSWTIFSAFARATLRDWAALLWMRLVLVMLYTLLNFALLRLFGVPVPFSVILLYNPVLTFIGTIPITVSGIGTTQVAMRELYGPFATVPRVDAFSTTTIFLYQLTRLLIASAYVRRVRRELEQARLEENAANAENAEAHAG